jgi:V8-like Glu-specific endopeptidase
MTKVIQWGLIILAIVGCGDKLSSPVTINSMIIGGEQVLDPEADFVVAIFNDEDKFFCSGALVSPTLVVTAAHCVFGHKISSIGIGNSAPFEHYPVATFKHHPLYMATITNSFYVPGLNNEAQNHDHTKWDYGYITLAKPVNNVTPVNFLSDYKSVKVSDLVTHYGFGKSDDESTGVKRNVEVPITKTDFQLMISGIDKKGICFGDSGGPVIKNGSLLAVHSQLSGQTTNEDGTITCGKGDGNGQSLWWSRASCWLKKNTGLNINAIQNEDCSKQNLKEACYSSQSIEFRNFCTELVQKRNVNVDQISFCGSLKYFDAALKCLKNL